MDVFVNYDEYLEEVKDNDEITKSQRFTESQFDRFDEAQEKWDTLMKKSYHNLSDEYEYKFTDQALIETAEGNDWNFDEDGNQV
jgi:hypothetical protein